MIYSYSKMTIMCRELHNYLRKKVMCRQSTKFYFKIIILKVNTLTIYNKLNINMNLYYCVQELKHMLFYIFYVTFFFILISTLFFLNKKPNNFFYFFLSLLPIFTVSVSFFSAKDTRSCNRGDWERIKQQSLTIKHPNRNILKPLTTNSFSWSLSRPFPTQKSTS